MPRSPRARPGLDQVLAAVREGDTLVVPSPAKEQQTELRRMHDSGDYSIADLTELFSVGRATVHRTLQRDQSSAEA